MEEELKEAIDESLGEDFEMEIWLSTDGKHTIRASANTSNGRKRAMETAVKAYDFVVGKYGTKQGQSVKEYGKAPPRASGDATAPSLPCHVCGAPTIFKTGTKNNKKWSAYFCSTDNKSHVKWG